jgi:hypothetical protein
MPKMFNTKIIPVKHNPRTEILLIFATSTLIYMKSKNLLFILAFQLVFLLNANAQLLLNEVKVNPPGNDNPFEFIELKGTPGSLISNTYLLIIEGDSASAGNADLVIRLNNITLGSNGLYFIGTSLGYPISAPTILRDTLIFGIPGGIIENGSSTFLLVYSTTPIIYGLDYDTNNDGTLELPAGATIVDSFGWISAGATAAVLYSSAVIAQGSGTPDAAVRFYGNNVANSAAAWYCGDLIGTGVSGTFDALEISFNFPAGGALSPGDHNLPNTLSVKEIVPSNKLIISPNPAQNKIRVNGIKNNASFQIFDLTGKLKMSGQVLPNQLEIDVQEFTDGLYLLKVYNAQELYCSKFEIHK